MEDVFAVYDCFKSVVKQPELFLKQQSAEKMDRKIRQRMIEPIYKCSLSLQNKRGETKSKAIRKIVTDEMDPESIWQQLEIQNEESFRSCLKEVSHFLAIDSQRFLLISEKDASTSDFHENEENEQESEEEFYKAAPPAADNDDDSDGESEKAESPARKAGKNRGQKSIVDDQFFKLSEMEEFLKEQDRREMTGGLSRSEDEIDYFQDDDDDDDNAEINLQESLKYSDFFDSANENSNDDDEPSETEVGDEANNERSSYEVRQDRLKKKITRMEEDMLEKRSWQMRGEVKADSRPLNSLLEEILEFDSTTRPAPVITETVSVQLEDVIKQRIKDRAFDDVVRKIKPSDLQYEFKKQIVLDQEKSKQSLSQVYEKEYLNEALKNNPNAPEVQEEAEPKEHKEMRAELKDLFEKLDMLSNFHYTPRAAQPELKIITNLPTISLEEVAPVSVSSATMLAPEEIKVKQRGGNVIGASERTRTDKNRDRRHKKAFQRDKFRGQTNGREEVASKVVKSRNVEKMKISADTTTKSSSGFFGKLQDEMNLGKASDKAKGGMKKRKAEKQNHQAKKLKL